MNKSGSFGMALQQALSFSDFLIRIPRAEAVFWPGCALMQLDGEILQKTLSVLRRAEPGIRLAAGCCGQPSVYLFPRKAEARRRKLVQRLKKQGVQRIYTSCPNCTLQLRQLEEFAVIPLLPVLAEHIRQEDLAHVPGSFVWHDPCPTRTEPAQQEAARRLLALSGCDCCQPEHTGPRSRCCGNFHMMRTTDPEKSARMRQSRLAELEEGRTVLSSCEGCLGAFAGEGRDTCHLLELLFGKSQRRGWGNRIQTTKNAPIQ